jgi:single-stranded DNA-binding protein
MAGSFTWTANVRVGTVKPYERALVLTVVHELDRFTAGHGATSTPIWNTVVCFKPALRKQLASCLAPGDLVHLQGYVRTSAFTDDSDDKRRAVDLVVTQFDVLLKHIDGPFGRDS